MIGAKSFHRLATAEPIRADQLPAGAVEVVPDEEALEKRVETLVDLLANRTAAHLRLWASGPTGLK